MDDIGEVLMMASAVCHLLKLVRNTDCASATGIMYYGDKYLDNGEERSHVEVTLPTAALSFFPMEAFWFKPLEPPELAAGP